MDKSGGAIGSGMGVLTGASILKSTLAALIKTCINTLHLVQEEGTNWRDQLGRVFCVRSLVLILKTIENQEKILTRRVTSPEQN